MLQLQLFNDLSLFLNLLSLLRLLLFLVSKAAKHQREVADLERGIVKIRNSKPLLRYQF